MTDIKYITPVIIKRVVLDLPVFVFLIWVQDMIVVHHEYIREFIHSTADFKHLNESVTDGPYQALGGGGEETLKLCKNLLLLGGAYSTDTNTHREKQTEKLR